MITLLLLLGTFELIEGAFPRVATTVSWKIRTGAKKKNKTEDIAVHFQCTLTPQNGIGALDLRGRGDLLFWRGNPRIRRG